MQRPFSIDHEIYPFSSHWVEVDGIPIHYLDEGTGPTLLLLHGNFMWSFSYRHLIQRLRSQFRCIAIDLAGMGMSGKPHRINRPDFAYTYAEQSQIVTQLIDTLDLNDITFLSFDHGGPIGIGAIINQPNRFSRMLIANSWAWSCHIYRASNLWSKIAPISKFGLRHLLSKRKRWLFESPKELADDRVWQACLAPYPTTADFKPMATLAAELTGAKDYFAEIRKGLQQLAELKIEIAWSTQQGGLFPEFVEESLMLKRWRTIFPEARVTLFPETHYYSLVTRPDQTFLGLLKNS